MNKTRFRGKVCKTCRKRKPFSEYFVADKKGRTRGSCKSCVNEKERVTKQGNRAERSATFKRWAEKNRASRLISSAKYRAMQRGLPFDLDRWRDDVKARLAHGVCEVTGIPFNLNGARAWDSPSIDRIVPASGYVIGNVRIVVFALNVMLNTWGEAPIFEIVDAIRLRRAAPQP